VVGEGEAGVQAARAEVVVADFLEGCGEGSGRRGERPQQREQRDGDQRRGSRALRN